MSNNTSDSAGTPVALLVGASRGLGLEIARVLHGDGYEVVLCSRDQESLDRAAEQLGSRVSTRVVDIIDAAQVQRAVASVEQEYGAIDVAIAIAGIIQVGPAEDMTLEHFDQAIDIMARGPIHVAWSVLPGMRKRRQGHIGIVASVGGVASPPHLLPYATAKFAAVGFADGLASALSGTGVTATTIVPGLMRTGSQDRATFTGNSAKEHAWFSVAASLPLLSIDATTAARRIVDGVVSGKPLVTLTPLTWMAYRVRGLMPATTTRVMGLAGRLLPGPSGNTEPIEGRKLPTPPLVDRLTVLARRAAARNNEE